jgi:hypothetical protein
MDDSSCAALEDNFFTTLDPTFPDFSITGLATAPADSQFGFSMDELDEPPLELIHQPSALAAPTTASFAAIPEVAMKRLRYAVDQIRRVPSMMVLENQTPWSHSKLYEDNMPRCMQGRGSILL